MSAAPAAGATGHLLELICDEEEEDRDGDSERPTGRRQSHGGGGTDRPLLAKTVSWHVDTYIGR